MFFVFDGIDGAGKSTQIDLFCRWLDSLNRQHVCCADPGSTELGKSLREILLRREDIAISAEAEMLMFMTARAQMVNEIIRPALDSGQVVVCDRFILSTAVYQGYAGKLEVDDIWEVGRIATAGLEPNLTFVFDLPHEEVGKRLGQTRDKMESRGELFFEKVSEGYRKLAAMDAEKYAVIDATLSVETIHQQIREIAEDQFTGGHS